MEQSIQVDYLNRALLPLGSKVCVKTTERKMKGGRVKRHNSCRPIYPITGLPNLSSKQISHDKKKKLLHWGVCHVLLTKCLSHQESLARNKCPGT